jgi:hypothetical protein
MSAWLPRRMSGEPVVLTSLLPKPGCSCVIHGLLKRVSPKWRDQPAGSSIPGFPPTCPKDVLNAPTYYNGV